MKTIHHVFDTAAPRDEVFAALTTTEGLSGWWTTIVKAEAAVGAVVHFTFAGDFNPDMRVTALEQPALVCWECIGGHEPWAQNTFRFELADKADGTIVRFWQNYARELTDDAYGTYNFNWGYYLESLRLLSETGTGKPFQAGSATKGVIMSNDELVRRFTEEFKNRSNFAVVDELMADGFVHHLPIPGIPPGRDGMKALGQFVTGAIRDITVHIDILIADGEFVANRNSNRGIRVDNGQEITWNEHEFWRVKDGRLQEQWSVASGLDIG